MDIHLSEPIFVRQPVAMLNIEGKKSIIEFERRMLELSYHVQQQSIINSVLTFFTATNKRKALEVKSLNHAQT
jgi:hypothetical protein